MLDRTFRPSGEGPMLFNPPSFSDHGGTVRGTNVARPFPERPESMVERPFEH